MFSAHFFTWPKSGIILLMHRYRIAALIISISGLSLAENLACTCAPVPTFCESVAREGSIDSNYLIIHAVVEDKAADWMQVRILDVFFGTPAEPVIMIPNGYGADCRMNIAPFIKGNQYIFALFGETYHLSICGVTWLEVKGEQVIGKIAPGINKIALADFPTIDNCGGIGSTLASISVFPTLTSQFVGIHASQPVEEVTIVMYDMLGRIALKFPSATLPASVPVEIETAGLPSGCYTLVLYLGRFRRTFRVLVQS